MMQFPTRQKSSSDGVPLDQLEIISNDDKGIPLDQLELAEPPKLNDSDLASIQEKYLPSKLPVTRYQKKLALANQPSRGKVVQGIDPTRALHRQVEIDADSILKANDPHQELVRQI